MSYHIMSYHGHRDYRPAWMDHPAYIQPHQPSPPAPPITPAGAPLARLDMRRAQDRSLTSRLTKTFLSCSTQRAATARQHIFGFFKASHCTSLHADLTAWVGVGTRGNGNGNGGGPPAEGAVSAKRAVLSSVVHPTGLPVEYHFLRMPVSGDDSASAAVTVPPSQGSPVVHKSSGRSDTTTSTPSSSRGAGSDFVLVLRPRSGRGDPTAPADDETLARRTSGSDMSITDADDATVVDPNVAIIRALQVHHIRALIFPFLHALNLFFFPSPYFRPLSNSRPTPTDLLSDPFFCSCCPTPVKGTRCRYTCKNPSTTRVQVAISVTFSGPTAAPAPRPRAPAF